MEYDPFQQKAIEHITDGYSVMVSAPTGSGKTAIAEHVIMDCLSRNEGVIYTAPIKALSNQKFRDFQQTFGDRIGILTGDVSINPSAPVLIMTTEIFRNKVLEAKDAFGGYSWIIFDEIHYIDDYERGTVWEESIIFLPEHMRILALSATVPNVDELASWVRSIHKKQFKVVKESSRPVPLHFLYQCQGKIADNLDEVRRLAQRARSFRSREFARQVHSKQNRPTALVRHLSDNDRLPCVYFVFGRRRCEYLADEMLGFNFLNGEERERIMSLYGELCARFDLAGEKSAAILSPLIERGIAYHHAGMLPTLKEVVERLFTSRLIKVIFTTETFALGINMPARSVIFDELRKFYGRYFGTLRTRDFYQMAGRAGRRGIDREGFVYSRVNTHDTTFQELKGIIYNEPEKVRSRFNASYATVLNLYEKHGEGLYGIYPLSFHYFQEKGPSRERALSMMRAKVKILIELGYIKAGRLTEKGRFASKVYGYELALGELYGKGVLEHLSESELAVLSLALVYEPRKGKERPHLSKGSRALCHITDKEVGEIHRTERRFGVSPLSKSYFYHLAPAVEAWMRNESFDAILRRADADEGEIIRYFRMGIQILREVLDTSAPAAFKEKARKAVDLMNRDIIDAERQLRA